jgi:outer membrane scaffolding protein for murein synthesis (MipA/OmpV family)
LKAGLGFAFADRTFQEVIYGVPDAFATATRSDYDARGGYMGAKLSVGAATLVTPVLRLVGQLRVDFHHGAANEASPLFLRKTTGTVLFGAVWSIVHSVRTVVE